MFITSVNYTFVLCYSCLQASLSFTSVLKIAVFTWYFIYYFALVLRGCLLHLN